MKIAFIVSKHVWRPTVKTIKRDIYLKILLSCAAFVLSIAANANQMIAQVTTTKIPGTQPNFSFNETFLSAFASGSITVAETPSFISLSGQGFVDSNGDGELDALAFLDFSFATFGLGTGIGIGTYETRGDFGDSTHAGFDVFASNGVSSYFRLPHPVGSVTISEFVLNGNDLRMTASFVGDCQCEGDTPDDGPLDAPSISGTFSYVGTVSVRRPIPEPSVFWLLSLGGICLGIAGKVRKGSNR